MKKNRDLESRLEEWGREYGGGRYENHDWPSESWLSRMIKYHGRAPEGLRATASSRTGADDVQDAVVVLERQPSGYIPSLVIRAEYLTPGQPIDMKLRRLRNVGESLSRVRYYQHLRIARIHVAAWIHLPFEEDEREVA